MKNTHIDEFLVQEIDEDGCELFIASLEEGGFRFGWKGGVIINVPKGHFIYNDILHTENLTDADWEWLENKFEEWLAFIGESIKLLRERRAYLS